MAIITTTHLTRFSFFFLCNDSRLLSQLRVMVFFCQNGIVRTSFFKWKINFGSSVKSQFCNASLCFHTCCPHTIKWITTNIFQSPTAYVLKVLSGKIFLGERMRKSSKKLNYNSDSILMLYLFYMIFFCWHNAVAGKKSYFNFHFILFDSVQLGSIFSPSWNGCSSCLIIKLFQKSLHVYRSIWYRKCLVQLKWFIRSLYTEVPNNFSGINSRQFFFKTRTMYRCIQFRITD